MPRWIRYRFWAAVMPWLAVSFACGSVAVDDDASNQADGGEDLPRVLDDATEAADDGDPPGDVPGDAGDATDEDGGSDGARDDSTEVADDGAAPDGDVPCSCRGNGDCDDGNTCNGAERCLDCACVPGSPSVNGALCDDADACTSGDVCFDGACAGTPLGCNDGNVCTTDSCNPSTGCVFFNNTAACDDGNPCTAPDACSGGLCRAGLEIPRWYRDADGDGFGAAGDHVCAASMPPGYQDDPLDCCDSNASVRPDQTSWFGTAYRCDGGPSSYDYNCDGVEEQRYAARGSCVNGVTACSFVAGWQVVVAPGCGSAAAFVAGCGSYPACTPDTETRTQECR